MSRYLEMLFQMLGDPDDVHPCADEWQEIEAEFAADLPLDYKKFIERYAPVELNNRLSFGHPGFELWNLLHWMRGTVEAFQECEWEEITATSLNPEQLSFGAGGLVPLASTNGGEYLFLLARPGGAAPLLVVHVGDDDDFYEYDMSFAEWLYRYLTDEEMAGPNSSLGWAGPVQVHKLPT
ncbi:SMI1/KNR4 family protein [Streptomyces sp. NPDC048111]|uniref:SMI1/KNR4 family protein n=1 Tax=Streptomyces sp. NPDC048111 TaxID=3365500 RepID=UPI00370FDD80